MVVVVIVYASRVPPRPFGSPKFCNNRKAFSRGVSVVVKKICEDMRMDVLIYVFAVYESTYLFVDMLSVPVNIHLRGPRGLVKRLLTLPKCF